MNKEQMKAKVKDILIKPKVELVEENGKEKLYLYGEIVEEVPRNWLTGEELDGDYITMDSVKKAFNESKTNDIEIHINSRGGDVYTSVAVGNFIKDSGKNVTVIVDAIAASGGSIIAMGADTIKMYPNSMMMIHRASALAYGNADQLMKVATSLEKFDESVLASYMEHFKGEKEELKQLIHEETFLTAEECLTLGLCDEIIEKPIEVTVDEVVEESIEDDSNPAVKVSLLEKYRPEMKIVASDQKTLIKTNLLNNFKGE